MKIGTDKLGPWLERALDLSSQRHRALSTNIANVDTPDYTPKDVEFSTFLARDLERPEGAPSGPSPEEEYRRDVEPGIDGNRVDLDQEVVRMTSNRVFHELATEIVNRRLALLRYSIDEGGR